MNRLAYLFSILVLAAFTAVLFNITPESPALTVDLTCIVALDFALRAALSAFRAKNAGKPGWLWALLVSVPIAGIVGVIYLLVIPPKPAAVS